MAQSQFWVPHASEVFQPAWFVKSEGDTSSYQAEDGEIITLPSKAEVEQITDPSALTGVADVCTLESVSDASLLHTIRTRYATDEIYTNVSRILLAVNPFKNLNIYEDQFLQLYQSAPDPSKLPPHIFGIGADVFYKLVDEKRSQAVLISGESGAGKTESTKLVLLYVSSVFGGSNRGDESTTFEDKILDVNPILEAFGNAKTVRNDNSSRFGKWIEVSVNPDSMRVCCASVTDYLLEVTRVCGQGPGERNYHIFYQLTQEVGTEDYEDLELSGGPAQFAYLKANPATCENVCDAEAFDKLQQSFTSLNFDNSEQDDIYSIVAGILHLGNMTFKPHEHQTDVEDSKVVARVAERFGVDAAVLSKCVLKKRLVVGKDVTFSPVGNQQAENARDSMAKMIYNRLFKWLVKKCNESLEANLDTDAKDNATPMPFVGVLDIAGFESFETNSLEQLFINLSNEKLQQYFNDAVFKSALEEYKGEGIDVGSITFQDNADILALIEAKGGLLLMLDDSTTGVKQTDLNYTAAIVKAHEKNSRFVKPKFPNQPLFGLRHFAGDVSYTTTGFLEKNVSLQPDEVVEMMSSSENDVLKELAEDPEASASPASGAAGAGAKKKTKATVSAAFRKSLQQLIDKFNNAGPHFVRCVKPNAAKVPDKLDSKMVLEQLRLSGVTEAVKIRKAGFPMRQKCVDFVKRYIMVAPSSKRTTILTDAGSTKSGVVTESVDGVLATRALLQVLSEMFASTVKAGEYAIGSTKVFLRDDLYRSLEQYRRLAFIGPALTIQSWYRGHRLRLVMREANSIYGDLKKIFADSGMEIRGDLGAYTSVIEKQRRVSVMEGSVAQMNILIKRAEQLSVKLPMLEQAMKLQARIDAEAKVARELETLGESTDTSEIEALLARAASYKMKTDSIASLEARCEKLKVQWPLAKNLEYAVDFDGASLDEIKTIVETAKAAGLDVAANWVVPDGAKHYEGALARQTKIEEERRAMAEAARKAAEEAAKEAARKAAEERKTQAASLKARISKASNEYDADELADAFREALQLILTHKMYGGGPEELGMADAEFAVAHKTYQNLQSGDFVFAEIRTLRQGLRPGSTGEEDSLSLLKKSNLTKQLEKLGLKVPQFSDEMKEVANEMMEKTSKTQRRSVFMSEDANEVKAAEAAFDDLANFSRIRTPKDWTKSSYLRYSPERIEDPLTDIEPTLEETARRNFANVLRCMGDKPSVYNGNKEQPIIELTTRCPSIIDEVYCQVIKQLTLNPSVRSASKGWSLLKTLCKTAAPCAELSEFIRAFLRKAVNSKETVSDLQGTGMRGSIAGMTERRRSTFGVQASEFLASRPQTATEALAALEVTCEAALEKNQGAGATPELLEVHTEDGHSVQLKVKAGSSMTDLYQRMLKALSIQNNTDGFEFFAGEWEDDCTPWRIIAHDVTVAEVANHVSDVGQYLLFGRVNLRQWEGLAVDDLTCARLAYQHAMRQYLGYALPLTDEQKDTIVPQVAAACVLVDKIYYKKKKKGKGHDRFNAKVESMKKDLDKALMGAGILERYVPAAVLPTVQKSSMANKIMDILDEQQNTIIQDEGVSAELVLKSRAIAEMQEKFPDFSAYVWNGVRNVAKGRFFNQGEVKWESVKWTMPGAPLSRSPGKKTTPKESLELPGGNNIDYQLLVDGESIRLREVGSVDAGFVIPYRRGGSERRNLIGWRPLPGKLLGLCVSQWQDGSGSKGSYVPLALALRVPEDSPEPICRFLSYYYC